MVKTIFEPKNEKAAGGQRIMKSFKIIRGDEKGGGHVVRVAEKRHAHRGLVETEVSPTFLPSSKSG